MAHLAIFRRVFVEQQQRLSEADYSQLVALCQVIPGPASSQVGLALGYRFGGLKGAFAAWLGFTLPSAVLMGLGAYFWLSGSLVDFAWVTVALKLVAVGIVTQAVIGMWESLCTERQLRVVALLAALGFYMAPTAWTQVGLIALALALGALRPSAIEATATPERSSTQGLRMGIGLICTVGLGLIGLSLIDSPSAGMQIVIGHFISGALVFGGGHVVLPLLQAEFVPPLAQQEFLAGYGLVQAMPGPLFTIASYLGVLMRPETPIFSASVALVAIFLPGFVLLAGAALVGGHWMPWLKPRLRFVNAVVVGLLASVLINPIFTQSVTSGATTALAMVSLLMAVMWKRSPLELVAAMLTLSFVFHSMEWI